MWKVSKENPQHSSQEEVFSSKPFIAMGAHLTSLLTQDVLGVQMLTQWEQAQTKWAAVNLSDWWLFSCGPKVRFILGILLRCIYWVTMVTRWQEKDCMLNIAAHNIFWGMFSFWREKSEAPAVWQPMCMRVMQLFCSLLTGCHISLPNASVTCETYTIQVHACPI